MRLCSPENRPILRFDSALAARKSTAVLRAKTNYDYNYAHIMPKGREENAKIVEGKLLGK